MGAMLEYWHIKRGLFRLPTPGLQYMRGEWLADICITLSLKKLMIELTLFDANRKKDK